MGKEATRSAGSHRKADLVVSDWEQVMFINVKKHERLRSVEEEKQLLDIPRPIKSSNVYTGFLRKRGKQTYIVLVNLVTGIEWVLFPLSKAEESRYQEMEKERIANKSKSKTKSRSILPRVQQTKITGRSKL
jgi:hypothetical protein